MTIKLRDLLPRVKQYRPDILDGQAMFFIQDAMRYVGQKAEIVRMTPTCFPAQAYRQVTVPNGEVSRIETTKVYAIPEGIKYIGEWDAAANNPYIGDTNGFKNGVNGWQRIHDDMPVKSSAPSVSMMGKNAVAISGDATGATPDTSVTPFYIYNATTSMWTGPFNIPGIRMGSSAAESRPNAHRSYPTLDDGSIFIAGIAGGAFTQQSPIQEYKSYILKLDGTILPGPDMPRGVRWVYDLRWVTSSSGKIILYGNADPTVRDGTALNALYELASDGSSVTLLPGATSAFALNRSPFGGNMEALSNNKILFCPGEAAAYRLSGVDYPSKWVIYDVAKGIFSQITQPTTIRGGINPIGGVSYIGTVGVGTKCFVWGSNITTSSLGPSVGSNVDIYDSDTNMWSTVASVPLSDGGTVNRAILFRTPGASNTMTMIGSRLYTSVNTSYIFDLSLYSYTNTNVIGLTTSDTDNHTISGNFGVMFIAGDSLGANRKTVYFNASSNIAQNNGWYAVSVPGNSRIGDLNSWEYNDVIYNKDGVWYQHKWHQAISIGQYNLPTLEMNSIQTDAPYGFPTTWDQQNGMLRIYPRPKSEYPIRCEVSFIPSLDFVDAGSIEINQEAETAIVEYALSKVYMLPGSGMNANLAAMYADNYKRSMTLLRAVGMFGYGGSPVYSVGKAFGPDRNTIAVNWMERF